MIKSLKQKNQPQIITFLVVNTCVLFAVMLGPNRVIEFLSQATKGDFALVGKLVAAPAVLSLLVGIIGWSLPRNLKEVLVFWRLGASRLPSSRVFSDLACRDDSKKVIRGRGPFIMTSFVLGRQTRFLRPANGVQPPSR